MSKKRNAWKIYCTNYLINFVNETVASTLFIHECTVLVFSIFDLIIRVMLRLMVWMKSWHDFINPHIFYSIIKKFLIIGTLSVTLLIYALDLIYITWKINQVINLFLMHTTCFTSLVNRYIYWMKVILKYFLICYILILSYVLGKFAPH